MREQAHGVGLDQGFVRRVAGLSLPVLPVQDYYALAPRGQLALWRKHIASALGRHGYVAAPQLAGQGG